MAYDNGKAKRFIRTRLELWAYACPYADERQRTIALAPVLDSYNRFRTGPRALAERHCAQWRRHDLPSRASCSSAAAGPHVPAA